MTYITIFLQQEYKPLTKKEIRKEIQILSSRYIYDRAQTTLFMTVVKQWKKEFYLKFKKQQKAVMMGLHAMCPVLKTQ